MKRFIRFLPKPMKLRSLSIVALVLAVLAVAGWMWLGKDGDSRPDPSVADKAGDARVASEVPGGDVPPAQGVPDSKDVGPSDSRAGQNPPPPPVKVSNSVVPGMPMVKGTAYVPRPPAAGARANGAAADSRPDWQVQGTADLAKVRGMLRDFRTRMGANPVGSNAEIMKAVMGGNPANARLGPPEGQELNAEGELVDRWGKPYFFHQLSKDSMEIRSAGPDGKMWTTDDLISK